MTRVLTFDPPALDALVHRATGHRPTRVESMPGGASTRRYLRVHTPAVSLVAMFVPDAAPEEISSGAHPADHGGSRWPFLEVHALLHGRGVRVPGVITPSQAAINGTRVPASYRFHLPNGHCAP